MPSAHIVVECDVPETPRTQQLSGMFDVPPQDKLRQEWEVDLPIDDPDWRIGLIVGPSGSGKTRIARELWGSKVDKRLKWDRKAPVVECFAADLTMDEIVNGCMAVGFNTIPSWLKPFGVLSNGEQFRVELARRMLEAGDLIVVDEFTSVVDRQVAKIACHSAQKFIRRKSTDKQFVAITCHYDVIDWLRPDWIYDPSKRKFARGSVQQATPQLDVTVGPVAYAAWDLFAPFHYLTASLARSARCWGLWLDGTLCAFAGVLHRPMSKAGYKRNPEGIVGISRVVTLPDFQGLGLAFVLMETVASVYTAIGKRFHMYPAHPGFIRAFDQSPRWAMRKRPGVFSAGAGKTSTIARQIASATRAGMGEQWRGGQGGRPCAVFRYAGPAMAREQAEHLLDYWRRDGGG